MLFKEAKYTTKIVLDLETIGTRDNTKNVLDLSTLELEMPIKTDEI